jgi:hypothetical protein
MNAVEHILLAHYTRIAAADNLAGLSDVCFMLDGPLAIFGQPAWLSKPLLRLINEGIAPPRPRRRPRRRCG